MADPSSHLMPGEQILGTVTAGRRWYHYALSIIMLCIIVPLLSGLWLRFTPFATFPSPGPHDPSWTWPVWYTIAYGCTFGFPLLLIYAGLMDFLKLILVELSLTNKRLTGRVSGAFNLFRSVNIPVDDIESLIVFKKRALQVKRKSAARPIYLSGFVNAQELVDKYHALVGH